jgi:biopolymer transport protein ExbD
MAAASNGDKSGIISGINVTPLVDITLVLLIIFIVTAKILVSPAVPLDLPKASKTEEVQVVLSVIISKDGQTRINAQPIGDDGDFVSAARDALDKDKDLRAVIQADGSVPHRTVIHTLDLLRSAGIERVAFAAVPEGDEGSK